MALTDYLNQLQIDKENLVNALTEKGLEVNADETFTSLVPKVTEIKGSFQPPYISFSGYNGTELNLDGLDTSKVEQFRGTFSNCPNLIKLDLSPLDFSNATYVSSLFSESYSLTTITGTTGWDLSNTSQYGHMALFSNLFSVDTLDVSNIKFPENGYLNSMFNSSAMTTIIGLNTWDISKIESIDNIFEDMGNIIEIDISTWDFSNVKFADMIVKNCTNLQFLDLRNFVPRSDITSNSPFDGIPVNCEIIVKDDTVKAWVLNKRSDLINVKTVAELEG